MENLKEFETRLTIEAKDQKDADRILEKMYSTLNRTELDQVIDSGLEDLDKRHYVERIRYDKDWKGHGEYFVFEGKMSDESDDQWGLDAAYKLFDLEVDGNTEKGVLIHYEALTKIRQLLDRRIDFWFSRN